MTRSNLLHAAAVTAPLFLPALDEAKLRKAQRVAEVALIDLEDAVPDHRKREAREWVGMLPAKGRELRWVRVNAVDTGLCEEDIAAVASRACVLVLPKCQSADDIGLAVRALQKAGSDAVLLPIVETARGIEALSEIAHADPQRVARLSLGLGDFHRNMAVPWDSSGPLAQYARCRVAVASRAAGLPPPIDSVISRLGDPQFLDDDIARGRDAGFGGKFCIHPDQVARVRAGFAPRPQQVVQARSIMEAFHAALGRGSAAIVVDGLFVDYPVAEQAEELLVRAGQPSGLLPIRHSRQEVTP
jgi:citrate lyase subunit beta/citryl-CoA lyase